MEEKKKIRLKLDSPNNIRKSLAKISNTIILACNAILGSIRADEQEKKIRELQELLEDIQK